MRAKIRMESGVTKWPLWMIKTRKCTRFFFAITVFFQPENLKGSVALGNNFTKFVYFALEIISKTSRVPWCLGGASRYKKILVKQKKYLGNKRKLSRCSRFRYGWSSVIAYHWIFILFFVFICKSWKPSQSHVCVIRSQKSRKLFASADQGNRLKISKEISDGYMNTSQDNKIFGITTAQPYALGRESRVAWLNNCYGTVYLYTKCIV